jgi:hypothetical protein
LWIDVEATIAGRDDCLGVEDAVAQHIGAIEAWLDTLS